MSKAKKVFWMIFGFGLLGGLLVGVMNLIAPETGNVTLNGENVEGAAALMTSIFAGGIPGLIFGLIAAGIVSLFTRKKKD